MKTKFKKGIKIVSLIAAVAIMAGCMAGCGKDEKVTDDQGRTIISVGSWPTKEGKDKENMEARKARFEEANKDFVIQPDNWAFDLKSFYSKAAAGQLPTVYGTHFTEMPQIIAAGYSADLTDELKKTGIYDKINKDVLKLLEKDGRVYAVPFAAYALGLSFNVSDFEKAGLMNADGTPQQPKTWDELAQFAVKLKQATGKPGFVFPTMNNNGGWQFTQIAWSYGANFMEQDSNGKWKAVFNSPECAAALQWVKDLKWKYDVLPPNTLVDGTEMYKVFGTGNASMIISAGDVARYLVTYDMDTDNFGIMATPAGPKKWVTLMGGSIYAISPKATAKQIEGALKWIEMTNTPDATDEYKQNQENSYRLNVEDGQLVTIKSMSPWNSESSAVKFRDEMVEKYKNGNPAHVKLYNDFVQDMGDCELRAEEPICAQELYGILDGCIQEVLTNKDADPATLLEKANSDFQNNYLDNADY
ncbi:MAG: extracellular solute-binding protein [Eubacteriales bacterium]|nr:extracellular solute-binding protein [Eubacteriales bacterium]MDY4213629.1 extracellular solute-binding protein [Eubacteriales bacterium]